MNGRGNNSFLVAAFFQGKFNFEHLIDDSSIKVQGARALQWPDVGHGKMVQHAKPTTELAPKSSI